MLTRSVLYLACYAAGWLSHGTGAGSVFERLSSAPECWACLLPSVVGVAWPARCAHQPRSPSTPGRRAFVVCGFLPFDRSPLRHRETWSSCSAAVAAPQRTTSSRLGLSESLDLRTADLPPAALARRHLESHVRGLPGPGSPVLARVFYFLLLFSYVSVSLLYYALARFVRCGAWTYL